MYRCLLFVVLLSLFGLAQCYIEYDGWINVQLLHNLSPEKPYVFVYRANITISTLNSRFTNVVQSNLPEHVLASLKKLAQDNGFYRLKAVVEYPDGSNRELTTATNACDIIKSQLSDEIWIAVDGMGYVNAVTVTATNSQTSKCSESDIAELTVQKFNTGLVIKQFELAPLPDTASFVQKIEREREARERGENKDNRGFFAKYWIYIVPLVILIFLSGASNPDQQK